MPFGVHRIGGIESVMIKNNSNKDNKFIIKSKQKPIKKLVSVILTCFLWIYSFLVFYFFISAIFKGNHQYIGVVKEVFQMSNVTINEFLIIIIWLLILNFSFLVIWKIYNKKRYGNLNSRKYPKDTTAEEMLSLNLVTEEMFKKLQKNGVLVFEENPIKEL